MFIAILLTICMFFGSMHQVAHHMLNHRQVNAVAWMIVAMFAFAIITLICAVQYYMFMPH
jgi:uncharacterized Rmd1/YagE family protein